MGIPSYFSYIVKNHGNIINKLNNKTLSHIGGKIDNLYLDSNSIIYDTYHLLMKQYSSASSNITKKSFEQILINETCKTIEKYIKQIGPTSCVIIAFDGVAPVAKLEQQRNRRYKSWFMTTLEKEYKSKYNNGNKKEQKKEQTTFEWNTSNITPGTEFMNTLSDHVNMYFSNTKTSELKLNKVIISSTKEEGEGEHKIFQYIRDNKKYHRNTTSVIYGLDADLIMLTLNHLHISENLYLFRETPHFIRQIDSSLDPNMTYMMNIPKLGKIIAQELSGKTLKTNTLDKRTLLYVNDYILICFLLGNDFMPHFPALNIRTNGIQYMINAYIETVGKHNYHLSKDGVLHWKNIRRFIGYLAENEEKYLKNEYKLRSRLEKRRHNRDDSNDEDIFKSIESKLLTMPIKRRQKEKYIDPNTYGWENRYYKILFKTDIDDIRLKQICKNYLEALEWTYKYYNTNCYDWRWCYKYNYPPLLKHLIKYIPYFDTEFISEKPKVAVTPYTQLSYVLPTSYLNLLPKHIEIMLKEKHNIWYDNSDIDFEWSFCKYFWESHVCLPHINLDILEKDIDLCVKQESMRKKFEKPFDFSYLH